LVLHGDLEPAFQRFWQDTKDRYRLVQGDPERPALPPDALFLTAEQFYSGTHQHAQLALRQVAPDGTETHADNTLAQALPDLTVVRGAEEPLAKLQAHIRNSAHRVLILAESAGRRESLLDFLRASGVSPPAFDDLKEFLASDEKIQASTGLKPASIWSQRLNCLPLVSPHADVKNKNKLAMLKR
jgi:transcription-repair coupling factor (superfamily II helicase)